MIKHSIENTVMLRSILFLSAKDPSQKAQPGWYRKLHQELLGEGRVLCIVMPMEIVCSDKALIGAVN